MTIAITRRPWAAGLIGLIFGPVFGMLYLNKGRWALYYLAVIVALLTVPLIIANSGIVSFDPYKAANLILWITQIGGAFHCFRTAKKQQPQSLKWYAHWYSLALLVVLPIALAWMFRTFCYEPFSVPSMGMEPTLDKGDYFYASKYIYDAKHLPQRGDVIIFNAMANGKPTQYVKRVIGLPGEKIELNKGVISINGIALDQQPIGGTSAGHTKLVETLPEGKKINLFENDYGASKDGQYDVPQGQYFVMGDNRGLSLDSSNSLGFVPLEKITGKATAVFWNTATHKLTYRPVE